MSGLLGLSAQPGPHGVRVWIVRSDGHRVGHVDYTAEQAAQVINQLLTAIKGQKNLAITEEAGR